MLNLKTIIRNISNFKQKIRTTYEGLKNNNQPNQRNSMKTYIDNDGIERLQLEKLPKSHFALLKKCKMPRLHSRKEARIRQTGRNPFYLYYFPWSPRKRVLGDVYDFNIPYTNPTKRAHMLLRDPRYNWKDITWVVNCFRDYFNPHV